VKKKAETPAKKTAAKKIPAKKTAAAKKTTPKPTTRKVPLIREAFGEDLAKIIAQGMFEKKAEDIKILDMRGIPGSSADFFVISHATSDKQVEAIADSAEDETHKKTGEWPRHREGYENLEWILLDYFDVVAHIFQQEKREFYGIEDLWGDSKVVTFKGK
jgi:ribosome-associated protein